MSARAKTLGEHLKDGTFRPRRHAGMVVAAGRPIVPPTKPRGLAGPAGKLWDQLVEQLAGIVSVSDTVSLTLLCRWWAELERVEKALRKAAPGSLEHGRLGRSFAAASAQLGPLLTRFGLDPTSRERLPAPRDIEAEDAEEARRREIETLFFSKKGAGK